MATTDIQLINNIEIKGEYFECNEENSKVVGRVGFQREHVGQNNTKRKVKERQLEVEIAITNLETRQFLVDVCDEAIAVEYTNGERELFDGCVFMDEEESGDYSKFTYKAPTLGEKL